MSKMFFLTEFNNLLLKLSHNYYYMFDIVQQSRDEHIKSRMYSNSEKCGLLLLILIDFKF